MPRVYNRKRCGARGTTAGGGVYLLVEGDFDNFMTNRSTALEMILQIQINGAIPSSF